MNKPQIHISGLQTLWKCGIQYENRYLLGLRTPTPVNMIVGTAVHRGLANDLEHKRDHGKPAPLDQVQDLARDTVAEELRIQDVSSAPEDIEDGLDRSNAPDKATALVRLAHEQAVPDLFNGPDAAVKHVERQWTLDVAEMPFQLAGTIDVQQGADYQRDWKTSGKSPVKTMAETSAQLTMYAMAQKVIDGSIPESMGLNYLVQTPKRGDLKFVELQTTRTVEDFGPLLARVRLAHAQIQAGVFHPAPMDSWQCSDKWCPYFRQCAYSNKRTLITIGGAS